MLRMDSLSCETFLLLAGTLCPCDFLALIIIASARLSRRAKLPEILLSTFSQRSYLGPQFQNKFLCFLCLSNCFSKIFSYHGVLHSARRRNEPIHRSTGESLSLRNSSYLLGELCCSCNFLNSAVPTLISGGHRWYVLERHRPFWRCRGDVPLNDRALHGFRFLELERSALSTSTGHGFPWCASSCLSFKQKR